jgi:DNA helicase HerA-like ATPase
LNGKVLGRVVGGSLVQGLKVRLDEGVSVEAMGMGRYVTIEGEKGRFFGLVTDVELGALERGLELDVTDPYVARVLSGTGVFGTIKVVPQLALGVVGLEAPQPARTIPAPFSLVREASEQDMALVFGSEDEKHFYVGSPLDLEVKVCLDLDRFVQRSAGVFGKTGTGKTMLTRLLLAGILQGGQASTLVFDMHSEYGWEGEREEGGMVKGLKQLFPSRVAVFTLDEESARRRRVKTDFTVLIGYDEIEPEDIALLRETLNLTELAVQAVYQLARHFGEKKWLMSFLDLQDADGQEELAQKLNIAEATYRNLSRGMERLRRMSFLVPHSPESAVERILGYLEKGLTVVLEFGRYRDIVPYMLVANLLSRRLHDQYVQRTERARGEGASHPRPLLIVIEEAHKFLSLELSRHTIFGTIAREMRKFYVSLLVIDQRPSGIDEEVMSQVGSKITCLLDNEKDIDSVLAGVPERTELRKVLSRLDSRQQALMFGHALPVPVVVRVRDYSSIYRKPPELKGVEQDRKDLWEE